MAAKKRTDGRAKQEMEMLKLVRHPNIVQVFGYTVGPNPQSDIYIILVCRSV